VEALPVKGGLDHFAVPSPKFPFTGQDSLPNIFGKVPRLQLGFRIIAVVLLEDMAGDGGIPGEDYPG
jgi:hypothetical protein